MLKFLKTIEVRHWMLMAFGAVSLFWVVPATVGMLENMHDTSQHMEYVWLVPVLTGLLLWSRWGRIKASLVGAPAPWLALPLFLLAMFFIFFGLRGGQIRFLQIAAVCFLLAMPLACYGKRTFALTWFPILLLLFILPVGFLDNFTVPLRRASVTVTTALLNGLGIPVAQQGTAIFAKGAPFFSLDVADPCSGIRSIVALFAGTAAYGAFALHRVKLRWALFLASVPIAFVGNVIRLLLTAVACHLVSQAVGMQLHDNALFIVAPFYVLSVFWLTDLLKKRDRAPADEPPATTVTPSRGTLCVQVVLCLALLGFRWTAARELPPAEFESDAFLNHTFEALPGATMRYPWYCQNRACLWVEEKDEAEDTQDAKDCPKCEHDEGVLRRVSRAELDILPADTFSRRVNYTLEDGSEFSVSLVIAGRNRMSIHRPELCLPAQGYTMHDRTLHEVLPGLPMMCFALTQEGRRRRSGFGYVFLNSEGATVSNIHRVLGDCWERSIHNRIQRWAMVTVRSPHYDFTTPEGAEALQRFMKLWYPTLRKGEP